MPWENTTSLQPVEWSSLWVAKGKRNLLISSQINSVSLEYFRGFRGPSSYTKLWRRLLAEFKLRYEGFVISKFRRYEKIVLKRRLRTGVGFPSLGFYYCPWFSLFPTLGYYPALGFLFFPPLATIQPLVLTSSHPWLLFSPWFSTFTHPWLLCRPELVFSRWE